MLTEQERQYLIKLFAIAKQKCKTEYGVDIEQQLQYHTDKSLDDNKIIILNAIKQEKELKLKQKAEKKAKSDTQLSSSKEERLKKEMEKAQKEKEQIEKMKAEEENIIRSWKEQFRPDMIIKSPAYFEMEKYIEMVCEGHSNFCVICSQGGLAKTWSSQAILKKKGVDYTYLNSFTTPLELYNFFYCICRSIRHLNPILSGS